MPKSLVEIAVLDRITNELTDREFEYAAVEIAQLMDNRFCEFQVTQRSRDGGRDAIGKYRVGHNDHQIHLTALIEAKLWKESSDIGVKPMSRLISRIKHRDIGVFVTTSCFNKQVQQELIEDNHPIILVSGGDIARVLVANELNVPTKMDAWLESIKQHASAK
ncbi:restriction endonuclease [Dechloromonas sp.]|uniref:restriction endonuclease n=1 Tax=Dechloromonas sp. TaxID=1917218 RepID=UPI00263F9567|nr:restriction endonuclease [Dechloromonas sp.]